MNLSSSYKVGTSPVLFIFCLYSFFIFIIYSKLLSLYYVTLYTPNYSALNISPCKGIYLISAFIFFSCKANNALWAKGQILFVKIIILVN